MVEWILNFFYFVLAVILLVLLSLKALYGQKINQVILHCYYNLPRRMKQQTSQPYKVLVYLGHFQKKFLSLRFLGVKKLLDGNETNPIWLCPFTSASNTRL